MAAATRGRAGRLGWGLGDQALSSLTNFFVSIVAARSLSPEAFGAFALAFAAYAIALGVSRALSTEPLVVRFTGAQPLERRDAQRASLGAALLIGLGIGVLCIVAATWISPLHRPLLLALGVSMPGLLLQDAWRYAFFAQGRGSQAFLNDLVWFAALVMGFGAVTLFHGASAATMLLVWGAAGGVAAAAGVWQDRTLPSVRRAWPWLRAHRDLNTRYLIETLALTGVMQACFFAIGAIAGLAAVGRIRLVQVVLGPVNILVQGIGIAALPEAVRALARSQRVLDRFAIGVSAIVGAGSAAWGLCVLALPDHVLDRAVGPTWAAASVLLVPLVMLQVFNGLNTGAYLGIRALMAVNRGLFTRLLSSALSLAAAVVGAAVGGAEGAVLGLAGAAALSAALWWWQYRAARRPTPPTPHSPADAPVPRLTATATAVGA